MNSRFTRFLSSPNNKAILWMVLGGFDFATMAALIHALGKESDWLVLAFLRMFLSFVFSSSSQCALASRPLCSTSRSYGSVASSAARRWWRRSTRSRAFRYRTSP
ncbi:MAG: hypothetical protein R3B51_07035 [Thermodesulfobacteriota bacterium]